MFHRGKILKTIASNGPFCHCENKFPWDLRVSMYFLMHLGLRLRIIFYPWSQLSFLLEYIFEGLRDSVEMSWFLVLSNGISYHDELMKELWQGKLQINPITYYKLAEGLGKRFKNYRNHGLSTHIEAQIFHSLMSPIIFMTSSQTETPFTHFRV